MSLFYRAVIDVDFEPDKEWSEYEKQLKNKIDEVNQKIFDDFQNQSNNMLALFFLDKKKMISYIAYDLNECFATKVDVCKDIRHILKSAGCEIQSKLCKRREDFQRCWIRIPFERKSGL